MPFVCALEITVQQNVMNSTIHRFIIHVYIIKLWMRTSFLQPLPSKIQKTASIMYKNKINVANKTNSSELVSPYIGFLSIFCTELSAPIGRDALCQRPSTTRLTTVNKVLHNRWTPIILIVSPYCAPILFLLWAQLQSIGKRSFTKLIPCLHETHIV